MARGRRRAAVAPAVDTPDAEADSAGSDAGDVDDFIEERHRRMAADGELEDGGDDEEDAGSDLGIGAAAPVMDLDVDLSSSDDDDDDASEDDADAAGDPDTQWGARRRSWYGGDTHEYEIMDDEEREDALRDEEEEARRLQAKAFSALERSDFLGSSEDEADSEGEGGTADKKDDVEEKLPAPKASAESAVAVAPELPALLTDLRECLAELAAANAQRKTMSGPVPRKAQIRFHIAASYATNIAFYLALRTDPDAANVDVRSHQVIGEIVKLRALRQASLPYPKVEIAANDDADTGVDVKRDGFLGSADADASPSPMPAESGAREDEKEETGADTLSKLRKRKKRSKRSSKAGLTPEPAAHDDDDDDFVRSIFGDVHEGPDKHGEDDGDESADVKRRKLNQIVGQLERERQSKEARKAVPVDMQALRQEPAPPRREAAAAHNGDDGEEELSKFANERALKKKAKKEARIAKKQASESPHVYTFDDRINGEDKDLRRKASSDIVQNRGLTRYRPRDKKTPRTKRREAFSKAVKKRRSVVRDPVQAKPNSYGGEASGINMRATKSARLGDV